MQKSLASRPELWFFLALAGLGLATHLLGLEPPHRPIVFDARWVFGLVGFALLRRWWWAWLLSVILSIPWSLGGLLPGLSANQLHAIPTLAVVRLLHRPMLDRFGPGWRYGLGWAVAVMVCYEAFYVPVHGGLAAWMADSSLIPGIVASWAGQPFLLQAVGVSLFSAAAMLAILTYRQSRGHARRMRRVNQVLLGIREINQLIVTQMDSSCLARRACASLTETSGYDGAWIALLDRDGGFSTVCQSGRGDRIERLPRQLDDGQLPPLAAEAMESQHPVLSTDTGDGGQVRSLAVCLRHEGARLGVLVVSVPADWQVDDQQEALLGELAGDLASAVYRLEIMEHKDRSRQMLARTERIARVGSWEWQIEGDRVKWSDELFRIFGLPRSPEAPSFAEHSQLYLPEDRRRLAEAVDECVRNGTPYTLEASIRRPSGEIRHCLVRGMAERGDDGEINRLMGSLQDITEQKQAEMALRASEAMMRYIVKYDPNALAVYDRDLRYIAVSDRYLNDYGLGDQDILGKHHYEVFPEMPQRWKQVHQRVLAGATEQNDDDWFRRPDGSVTYNRWQCRPWYTAQGDIGGMITYTEVTTERKLAEMALRDSEAKFRSYIENAPFGVFLADREGRYVDVNPAATRMTGYSRDELLQMRIHDLVPPESMDEGLSHFRRLLEEGQASDEICYRRRDGQVRYWLVSAVAMDEDRLLGFAEDVTQRRSAQEQQRRLQEQLAQSQKMEAVGRLAGGVAHDFNNMLNVILGHTELSLMELPGDSDLREPLEEIRSAAQRSAELTRQLLAFARKQTIAPRDIRLNETVESMLNMLNRLIGEDIDLRWEPSVEEARVRMDPTQLNQLLTNLVVNARDAISGVGHILIETGQSLLDQEYADQHEGVKAGRYATLTVTDTGPGMDEQTVSQIFEPFFTTKADGEGTGLGLATVYGIVKQNNGFINVYSEPGHGTTFRVHIPLATSHHEPEASDLPGEHRGCSGDETILLVEDEQSILHLGKKMLERSGYRVIPASSPGAALRLAREHSGEIHLLITDVVMPEMNGRDLAKQLISLYPRIKRLFMSGYTANVIAHRGVLDEGVRFIQKPFGRDELTRAVRDALEEA
jgi:PAS domain S-box-containing protein